MKVLVFGGTFNPPHLGHQLMIEQVMSKPLSDGVFFDQLWLLPVGQHSFTKKFLDKNHRLMMLGLMRNSLVSQKPSLQGKILIENYEIDRDDVESQTYSTLEALAQKYPQHQFSFLIGSDNLVKFHLWHDYEKMLQKYPFYVYPRQGYDFKPFYQGMIALKSFPQMGVSSTKVRQVLESREDLKGLLDQAIISYISSQELFV